MTYRTASAAAKTSVLGTLAMVALALTLGPHAFAQQPSTNPPVPPAQAAPEPNAGQTQQAAPAETVQNGQQQGVDAQLGRNQREDGRPLGHFAFVFASHVSLPLPRG